MIQIMKEAEYPQRNQLSRQRRQGLFHRGDTTPDRCLGRAEMKIPSSSMAGVHTADASRSGPSIVASGSTPDDGVDSSS